MSEPDHTTILAGARIAAAHDCLINCPECGAVDSYRRDTLSEAVELARAVVRSTDDVPWLRLRALGFLAKVEGAVP